MLKNLIKLKKANIRDLDINWINWLNDKKVNKFSEKKNRIHTLRSQKIYLKNLFRNKSKILFMIRYKNKNIGTMLISKISIFKKECEISYMIGDKSLWNKNIGTHVIELIANYIFNKRNFKKVYAGTRNDNFSSQKILKKNGFKLKKKIKNCIK
tara:strand:+ start:915 stop:1376 length:462 start_codon:yes stop_codon:yes gene_type:complete